MKPPLLITSGDPAGIGPEISLKAVLDKRVQDCCFPVVIGDRSVFDAVSRKLGMDFRLPQLPSPEWNKAAERVTGSFIDMSCLPPDHLPEPGIATADTGRAAYQYISHAVGALKANLAAGMVTAPISKAALHLAGVDFPGHTEILAHMSGRGKVCMMMASDEIITSLVTTHAALSEAAAGITINRIVDVIRLTASAVGRIIGKAPDITVCALNPHAGENGLFGNEEHDIIIPAIHEAAPMVNARIRGPLPADTAFIPSMRASTDAYIVMYHDQGLIPFKMLAFDHGVNITLGLPFIRTSVDHGTACDIAWQGIASPESMVQAILWAARLAAGSVPSNP